MSAIAEPTATTLEQVSLPKGDPCVMVIFGATGDLTRRKLMPALFRLMCEGCLDEVHVLCLGRSSVSDQQFREMVRESVEASSKIERGSDEDWNKFAERITYLAGEIDKEETYLQLASRLEEMTRKGASSNHLFYIATPPSVFTTIVDCLGKAGLAKQDQAPSPHRA